MKNHYIPKLILKQFAVNERVNTYNVLEEKFDCRKIKNTFFENDIFDPDLEARFARKIEGPFGDLLNHKLLCDSDSITINRDENLLIREFEMINHLRSPYTNLPEEKMMVNARDVDLIVYNFCKQFHLDELISSEKSYYEDLKSIMEYDSFEEACENREKMSKTLSFAVECAMASYYEIWDSSKCGQEFILSKMPRICLLDYAGPGYKAYTLIN